MQRARRLIGTLKRQLQAWAEAHRDFIEAVQDETTKQIYLTTAGDTKMLGRISITSGETIYNLRAALDYVVYDLARIGVGKPVAGTQFPIEETQAKFNSRISGKNAKGEPVPQHLKGVPPGAIRLIAQLQPFAGCRWTRELRDLSNPDKHRHLSSLRSNLAGKINEAEMVDFDPETLRGSLRIRFDAEVEVFFADDRPVLETLQDLCREVDATVQMFKSAVTSEPPS